MARKRGEKKVAHSENIVLHDSAGRVRVLLGIFDNDEYPTFQLNDEQERPRVIIQLEPSGRASISIQEESGGGLIGLGADPSGGIGFSITRPGGVPVLTVGWNETDGLTLSMWGHEGKPMWQGFEPGPAARQAERRRAENRNAEQSAAADRPRE